MEVIKRGGKKRKKEGNAVRVWRRKKEGEKKEKRRKCYHNIFTINFKRWVIIG